MDGEVLIWTPTNDFARTLDLDSGEMDPGRSCRRFAPVGLVLPKGSVSSPRPPAICAGVRDVLEFA